MNKPTNYSINQAKAENVNKWIAARGGVKFMRSLIAEFPGGHGLTRHLWKDYNYPGTDASIRKYLKNHGINLVNERSGT